MDTDEFETRAALRRVAEQAAALHRLLTSLPTDAARRVTGGEMDAISQLASRMLWSSTADLHQQGRHEDAKKVIERARGETAAGITELRLVTNSLDISEKFWTAIYADTAVDRVGGELRVSPPDGPVLLLVEALAAHLITTVDMEIVVNAGAADRLRAAGFDVSRDGRYVVDVNATDSTIRMEVRP